MHLDLHLGIRNTNVGEISTGWGSRNISGTCSNETSAVGTNRNNLFQQAYSSKRPSIKA